MRKMLGIIIGTLTIGLTVCFCLSACKGKKKNKALALKEAHNYSMGNKEREINQVLYFNDDNIFNTKEIINKIYVTNEEESKILQLQLNNVKKTGYTHKYDKTKYYSYNYSLTIPVISNDLYIDNAYFVINSDSKTFKINIGTFSIKYDEFLGNEEVLSLNALEGKCIHEPYQTLQYINIKIENKEYSNITINKMTMGSKIDLVKDESNELIMDSKNTNINETIIGYMEKEYKFYLSYKDMICLKESYITVEYTDDLGVHEQVFDTFNYYDNGYLIPNNDNVIYRIEF